MATKYTRESKLGGVRGRVAAQPGPLRVFGRMPPRQRLTVIYAGLGCFAVLLLLYHSLAGPSQFAGRPIEKGEGVVVEKRIESTAEPTYTLVVKVKLDDDFAPPEPVNTDAETWTQLAEGDRVAVIYQINRAQTRVRLREVGRIALQEPIR